MIHDIYQYKNTTVYIKEDCVELSYLGSRYKEKIKGTIVETLCYLLNNMKSNSFSIFIELRTLIFYTELSNKQNIVFDGFRYMIENV